MKDALALALVHFLWQGTALAAAGALLMRIAKVPSVRYAIGVATMLAMLLAPAMTFLVIQNQFGVAPAAPAMAAGVDLRIASTANPPLSTSASAGSSAVVLVPTTWILSVWMVGVIVFGLRFVGGWAVARRMATQSLAPVGEDLQALAAQLAARLKVRGAFRVCESAAVAVPMMIGWLRPVIVLPPAALVALPLAQLEALLAHELAHIRRHDYLVNLLQTGVETLCFYHPAVWWMSREVRRHREHCCDDVAVGVCDRLTYVTALSSLASIGTPQFALSATGGSLRDRVRRLIEPTTHSASPKGAWIAMLPILLVVSLVAPNAWVGQATTPATTSPAVEVNQERRVERRAAREIERAEQVEREARSRAATRTTELRKRTQEVERQIARRQAERQRVIRVPEVEMVILENRLRQEEIALSRQKELAERGLATESAFATVQEQVEALRRRVEAARADHNLIERESRLMRSQVVDRERTTATRRNLEVLDTATPLRSGDQLTISVAGEPDLPTTFAVRPDGSIRFPFLGTIRVQDSTVDQVRTAIQKLITDKGLARSPVVTVSAGRGR